MFYDEDSGLQSGQFNQEGSLAPRTSGYGARIRAWLRAGNVWQHPTYLTVRPEYKGFLGAFATRGAGSLPAYSVPLYSGDAPQTLQPVVDGEEPWESPPIGGL